MGKVRNSTTWQPHDLAILAEIYPVSTNKAVMEMLPKKWFAEPMSINSAKARH